MNDDRGDCKGKEFQTMGAKPGGVVISACSYSRITEAKLFFFSLLKVFTEILTFQFSTGYCIPLAIPPPLPVHHSQIGVHNSADR